MIYVVAKNFVKNDKLDEVKKLSVDLLAKTRKEPGCITYDLLQDPNDPSILVFIEKWESKDYLDAHMKSPHFLKIVPEIKKCCVKDGEATIYQEF